MTEFDRVHRRQLLGVLVALRPYLEHVVVIGGWVPALYREYGGLDWQGRISFTTEVDVLATSPLPVEMGQTLEEVLTDALFEPERKEGPSAVWSRSGPQGGTIEFLHPHTGHSRTLGRTRSLGAHGRVGSLGLADLNIMAAHARFLDVPVRVREAGFTLKVRVPTLGAYLVNKGATYPSRRAYETGDNPKRAKDLVYVRDVIAAGSKVVTQLEADLLEISHAGRSEERIMSKARNNLQMTLNGNLHPEALEEAARMVSERDRLELAQARANMHGNLADTVDLLSRRL